MESPRESGGFLFTRSRVFDSDRSPARTAQLVRSKLAACSPDTAGLRQLVRRGKAGSRYQFVTKIIWKLTCIFEK
jgi:hypothetical protein